MTRLPLQSITLNRLGTIKVRVDGPNHCGMPSMVENGQMSVRYTINLVVGANSLDSEGFLIDQEALHTWMATTAQHPVSWTEPCEELCITWGRLLLEWISVQNLECTIFELDLTLSPAPNFGSFTAHFSGRHRIA